MLFLIDLPIPPLEPFLLPFALKKKLFSLKQKRASLKNDGFPSRDCLNFLHAAWKHAG